MQPCSSRGAISFPAAASSLQAGSPNDAASSLIERCRANLAACETLKNLLPPEIVMTVFVTKTDDDVVVMTALQDSVVESLVVQFLASIPPLVVAVAEAKRALGERERERAMQVCVCGNALCTRDWAVCLGLCGVWAAARRVRAPWPRSTARHGSVQPSRVAIAVTAALCVALLV